MKKRDPVVREDLNSIVNSLKQKIHLLEGKTILITGGSGFLGRYLVGTLLYCNKSVFKKPCFIISVDNYITSDKEIGEKEKNLRRINSDVSKPLHIKQRIDYIIHAAGIASPIYYRRYPLETIDVAVEGTRNLLELMRKKKAASMLFFSTSEIYGDPPASEIPTKETYRGNVSSIGPRACYDESKRLGEALCMSYFELYKTPVKIVRPFNIYGPGMRPNDYRVVPTFVWNALKGRQLPMHSKGQQTRAFCYIADAIVGFFKILLSSENGEVFNVGNDKTEVTVKELAFALNKVFKNKLDFDNVDYPENYPLGEPKRRCPDLTKISYSLKFAPKTNLHKGLKRTVEWCKDKWNLDMEYNI